MEDILRALLLTFQDTTKVNWLRVSVAQSSELSGHDGVVCNMDWHGERFLDITHNKKLQREMEASMVLSPPQNLQKTFPCGILCFLPALAFVIVDPVLCGPSDKRSKGKVSEVTLNSLMTASQEEDTNLTPVGDASS
mgnify:CR=1 FL=1